MRHQEDASQMRIMFQYIWLSGKEKRNCLISIYSLQAF